MKKIDTFWTSVMQTKLRKESMYVNQYENEVPYDTIVILIINLEMHLSKAFKIFDELSVWIVCKYSVHYCTLFHLKMYSVTFVLFLHSKFKTHFYKLTFFYKS